MSQPTTAGMRDTKAAPNSGLRLTLVHTIEGLMSTAANLLTIGVFFFTTRRLGWTLRANFTLSSFLGVVYIIGALLAHPLTERFGRRIPLGGAYLIIAIVTLLAGIWPNAVLSTIAIVLFALLSSISWPIMENLVSADAPDPHVLSRRLSVYNMVWAGTAAIAIAFSGWLINTYVSGIFLVPSVICLICALGVFLTPIEPADVDAASIAPTVPEPQLARQRVLALWLSRISLPAMYLMIYALAAMLPSLPVIQRLSPTNQTLVSSVWLITRFLSFIVLGASIFWHTRPRLLLVAGAGLLITLLLITLPDSLWVMIIAQAVFGITTGLIYAASLYFGMVLSEGSTAHGGYHEALIGLGMALGPAVGAITQYLSPGDQRSSIWAIAAMIALSILLGSVASLKLQRAQR